MHEITLGFRGQAETSETEKAQDSFARRFAEINAVIRDSP
jgi:hypothetical protein